MSFQVVVFSPDNFRGVIIKEVLQRSGFETLFLNRVVRAREATAEYSPHCLIFDTKDCLTDEISQLTHFFRNFQGIQIIVLGDPSTIENVEGFGLWQHLFLADPLDPEIIMLKVKGAVSPRVSRKQTEDGKLETILKRLLKLS